MTTLSYDVLLQIVAFSGTEELFNVALANREINAIASKYLYEKVQLHPPVLPLAPNSLDNHEGQPSGLSAFISARMPKHAPLVKNLEISGPFRDNWFELKIALQEALKAFTSLQSVSIRPSTSSFDFSETLVILRNCSSLCTLDVNSSCFDDELNAAMAISPADHPSALSSIAEGEEEENDEAEQHVPPPLSKAELLAHISGLTVLTLRDPSRKILQLLIPYWLNTLSGTLTELHLQGNCGSVTPGVLRSAIPQLRGIRSLTIGLSYSLTDRDLFSAFSQLPQLHTLQVNYYQQNTSPPFFPIIRSLKSLTAIDHSPVESLSLVDDTDFYYEASAPSFDGLVNHLVSVHAERLTSLNLHWCFVGTRAFERLCTSCSKLEKLSVGGRRSNLVFGPLRFCGTRYADSCLQQTFIDAASKHTLPLLHTASFSILNNRRSREEFNDELTSKIMKSKPLLRRVALNNKRWEVRIRTDTSINQLSTNVVRGKGSWRSSVDGSVTFGIKPSSSSW
ncbi:hypothetical protein V5O48_005236 [Marasmius crinis-equi]|uniref:F-box domain-containing protein n=1 Tax=Marasmius crinis-equi TaxID=585013 RepID=A0ABR3FMW1_9AGAR